MTNQHKLLYLYSLLQESGLSYIKCSKLVQELRKHFIVDLRYAIFTDDEYLKIDQDFGANSDSLRKQIIAESSCLTQNYDLIFIEHRLCIISDQKSEKVRAEFLKDFCRNGGSIVLNLTEQIDSLGDASKLETCNRFFSEVGLPTIRYPRSEEEFPDIHLVRKGYENQVIRGFEHDKKNKINNNYNYYSIDVDEKILTKIDPIFHPIFKDVKKLVVDGSVQVQDFPNRILLVGNATTQMITSGDLRWDGSLDHVFGAVNDTLGGCAVTIAGCLFADQIIESQETDNIHFMINLISYLINAKETILLLEETSNAQELTEVIDLVNELNDPRNSLFPIAIVQGTRGYIEKVAEQANICYSSCCYDACLVMIRRLIETLIIECFEHHSIPQDAQDVDGNYFHLSTLIAKFLNANQWQVGRNAKQGLPKVKNLGDLAAHNRRYLARKDDLDKISLDLRVVIEELVLIAEFDKSKTETSPD